MDINRKKSWGERLAKTRNEDTGNFLGMYFPLNMAEKSQEQPVGEAGKGTTFARPRDAP